MSVTAPARMAAVPEGSWPGIGARIALALVLLYAAASTVSWLHQGAEWPARSALDEISAYESTRAAWLPSLRD